MNQAAQLFTDADGNLHMDPWAMFEAWLDHHGMTEQFDQEPFAVLRWYEQYCDGEEQTGRLEI